MSGNELIAKTLSSGENYQVYIPDNVNSNTPIIFYEHGAGGWNGKGDYKVLNEHLNTTGSNAIVVEYNNQSDIDALKILTDISRDYNVPITNFRSAGFSFGLEPALRNMGKVIQQNPNMEPQSVFLVDGYWPGNSNVARDEQLLKTLGNNDTLIFAIHEPGITCNDSYYENWVNQYGINVLRLIDNTCYYNGYTDGHHAANDNYTYKGLLDFHAGVGKFPSTDFYTVEMFNGSSWVPVNIEGMTLSQVYEFVGIDTYGYKVTLLANLDSVNIQSLSVTSDSGTLGTCINRVIDKIKTSNFVQNNISFDGGFSSDTSVPSQIPGIVSSFFSSNASFLVTLANDMTAISQIGASFEKINHQLSILAGELDPNGIPIKNPSDTPPEEPAKPDEEPAVPKEEPAEPKEEPAKPDDKFVTEEGGILEEETGDDEVITEENAETSDDEKMKPNSKPENNGDGDVPNPTPNPTPNSNPNPTPNPTPNSNPNPNSNPAPNPNQPPLNNFDGGNPGIGDDIIYNNPLGEFPEYSEVYSNDNMIVYNYNDEYKIIIHTDEDKIIGIEHYYDFGNASNADHALDELMSQYSSNEDFENIVQSDRYVKVIFEADMYENMTIDDIRDKYSNLSEIIHL